MHSGEIDRLLERHRRGLIDATDRIWRLLNLQIWGDVFLNGKAVRSAEFGVRSLSSKF